MKIAKALLGIGLASGLLMGCGNNNGAGDNNGNRNNARPVRYNDTADNNDVRYNNVRYNTGRTDGNNGADLTNNNGNGNNNNNNNDVRVANRIARSIEDLKEVAQAFVIVTNDNAYVAVLLERNQNNDKLDKKLKNKISKVVKQTDPSINDVYISENPDFFDQMSDYVNDIRNGRPISGFFNQFNDTIQRVFPNGSR
ncbi:YhcN/YlaJ family sporulation lipoprotein [Heyndrickxia coagulans]|uniref:Sporulation lipoprotein, YhcN/YlaJ family n=1 Tax=Heyndrickxia coagulans DSM 1 = ATCC 7050 TaxID=1121088 RepID=A0A8B4BT64_HEYCO|nr:YhcN/YlaJ family sporulation lipoprotein [Heyndrickxia coagulans]AJH77875.1 lipoprotein yhcN [Heyndrickxia coagulans DSM 1 = ATCC 7050]MCR2845831.1 YhcN/YlaJ family sporulation lipoprotein [Heyndrickxia coagulans]MDR4223187.1 YhcN/YlaJ family sporulation lipoprotein [Heyndrickxia coagulans DSM 1 = ATCC 7050]MED4493140.1 YhcN/YlaJ family sporulation lipoprotein [Heyndrickxia coagulans]MED4535660.1 YhcN/YlaJ family sporulation lipoprotein [Heyndrickxia coagulans]